MFFELYKIVFMNLSIRSCSISFSSWISMGSSLKKDRSKIELLTDIDMLLMVEKELGEEYVIQFIDMQKQIINI